MPRETHVMRLQLVVRGVADKQAAVAVVTETFQARPEVPWIRVESCYPVTDARPPRRRRR